MPLEKEPLIDREHHQPPSRNRQVSKTVLLSMLALFGMGGGACVVNNSMKPKQCAEAPIDDSIPYAALEPGTSIIGKKIRLSEPGETPLVLQIVRSGKGYVIQINGTPYCVRHSVGDKNATEYLLGITRQEGEQFRADYQLGLAGCAELDIHQIRTAAKQLAENTEPSTRLHLRVQLKPMNLLPTMQSTEILQPIMEKIDTNRMLASK